MCLCIRPSCCAMPSAEGIRLQPAEKCSQAPINNNLGRKRGVDPVLEVLRDHGEADDVAFIANELSLDNLLTCDQHIE